jgi:Fur family ferric uptake transcriptional regulator
MLCLTCGKVIEFNDANLQARQNEIAEHYQFVIQERAMTLYGVCQDCQSKQK